MLNFSCLKSISGFLSDSFVVELSIPINLYSICIKSSFTLVTL